MSVLKDDVMSLDSSTSVLSKLSISTRDVISSTSSISDDDTVAVTATPKKRKMNEGITGNNQLHPDLQHVRKSERIVKPESRENLAALKLAILNILSVCNTKYSAKDIQEAITFKITDSTSHNLEVEDIVSLELGTDHIPDQLLCHTHPVIMFNRELRKK